MGHGINSWDMVDACKAVYEAYIAKNTKIVGPDFVCQPETYTLTNLPPGATVAWSIPSVGYSIIGSTTGTSVTVQASSNSNGQLYAVISTPCGADYTLTKSISRRQLEIVMEQGKPCGKATVIADVGAGPGTYTWTVTGDLSINGGGQSLVTSSNTIQVDGIVGGNISVSISGACAYTINMDENYLPYGAGQGVIGSTNWFPLMMGDPLTAFIESFAGAPFVIEYYWYLNGVLVHSGSSTEYNSNTDGGSEELKCGMNTLYVEALLDCGEMAPVGELIFDRICGGWYTITKDPAENVFIVSLEGEFAEDVELFNVILYDENDHEVLKVESRDGEIIRIHTQELKEGVYYVEVQRKDGETERSRFVIKGP